eukprot:286706-Ditylum_brightwellii.AAC.1
MQNHALTWGKEKANMNSSTEICSRSSDRSEVDDIFGTWFQSNPLPTVGDESAGKRDNKSLKYVCSQVMAVL